ncbi:MAG: PilZ domain-containing protein [Candidatus Sulfotelmatobacter sp.]
MYAALEFVKSLWGKNFLEIRTANGPEGRFVRTVSGEATEQQLTSESQQQTAIKHYAEMQSAPRFPLHLPVELKSQSGACSAETQNISANGVLFAMDRDVPVGSMVDFTILLPGDVVGSPSDVQIDCHGRVVRSFEDKGRRGVGVVIDEYHFERA